MIIYYIHIYIDINININIDIDVDVDVDVDVDIDILYHRLYKYPPLRPGLLQGKAQTFVTPMFLDCET